MINENDLIIKAKAGDEHAFEEIAKNYKALVTSVAKKFFLLGGDLDDLLQEGMIALYNAILTFNLEKQVTFYTYAKTCIENRIKNLVKSDSAYKNSFLNESMKYNEQGEVVIFNNVSEKTSVMHPIEFVSSPEDTFANNESAELLRSEIESKLSYLEVEVLRLFLDGLTYEQIAENLNINTKSVDNALNRIKNKVKYLKFKL